MAIIPTSTTANGIRCTIKQCVICPKLKFANTTKSSQTGFTHPTMKYGDANCSSTCLIYLITCNKCKIQYVGETSTTLKQRMSKHRNSFKNDKYNTYISNHFQANDHNPEDFTIEILDNHEENSNTQIRLSKELYWIKTLISAYPFGLNDQIKSFGNISNNLTLGKIKNHPFYSQNIQFETKKRRGKKRRSLKKGKNTKSIQELLTNIESLERTDLYKYYRCLSKHSVETLTNYMINNLDFNLLSPYVKRKIFAMVCNFLTNYKKENTIHKPDNYHYVKIRYYGQFMENINLSKIINKCIKETNTLVGSKIQQVRITYENELSIFHKIANYNSFLKELNNDMISNIIESECECKTTYKNFINSHHNHIVTGNLNIIENPKLRNLMEQGTKFREQKRYTINDIQTEVETTLNQFCKLIANKYQLHKNIENLVTNSILSQFKIKLRKQYIPYSNENNWHSLHKELKELQKHFIITCIDKAAGNFALTCKKLYVITMNKELGFDHVTRKNIASNPTYKIYDRETYSSIIKRHEITTKSLNLETKSKDLALPKIYAIPKMHKTPIKFRFITGAYNSSIKAISIDTQRILKHMKSHFKNYSETIRQRNGQKSSPYWSVDNSIEVVDDLRGIDNISNKLVYCADFSSLFTNLPHDVVKKHMFELIELCFKNSGKNYITVTYNKVFYNNPKENDSSRNTNRTYTKDDVKFMIEYILQNSFAVYGDNVYQQISGIPQGNNASPLIADLTLSHMEYTFMKQNPNFKHYQVRGYRYMDDLLIIYRHNDHDIISKIQSIYHNSLTLEQTSATDKQTVFLDLEITIKNQIITSLYNKTDEYSFEIVRYPKYNTNMKRSISWNCLNGEVLRIYRCCTETKTFMSRIKELRDKFIRNGFPSQEINMKIAYAVMQNKSLTIKYNLEKMESFLKLFN